MLNRRLLAALGSTALVLGCSSGGGTGTTTTTGPQEPCEAALRTLAVDTVLAYGDLTLVKDAYPGTPEMHTLVETMWLIADPLMRKGGVSIAINYLDTVTVNSCRDDDIHNWVLKAEEGSAEWRSGCLDGKLPADIAAVEPCAATATTTTAP